MRNLKRILLLTPILAVLSLGTFGLAYADSPPPPSATSIALTVPEQATVGSSVNLEAHLTDASGQPVAQRLITFYIPATFLAGATGLMRIGDATTDDQGVAVLPYVPKRDGATDVIAEYKGDSLHAYSQTTATTNVSGDVQLYVSQAGLKVPFVSKWLLVGFLSAVWGTLLYVVHLIVRIALVHPE